MARRRKRSTPRRKKKSGFPLLQWIVVVLVAVAAYKGLDYLISQLKDSPPSQPQRIAKPKKPATLKAQPKDPQQALPPQAFEETAQSYKLSTGTLLSFSQEKPGEKAGPQKLTGTAPGLLWLGEGQTKEKGQGLDFSKLRPALPDLDSISLEGPPLVDKDNFWREGDREIRGMKLFLKEDNRQVMAYALLSPEGITWAPLKHASGKKMPAAFILGTTEKFSKNLKTRHHKGKKYLILEIGELDELEPYKGYTWRRQSYYFNGQEFRYDVEYSKLLSRSP